MRMRRQRTQPQPKPRMDSPRGLVCHSFDANECQRSTSAKSRGKTNLRGHIDIKHGMDLTFGFIRSGRFIAWPNDQPDASLYVSPETRLAATVDVPTKGWFVPYCVEAWLMLIYHQSKRRGAFLRVLRSSSPVCRRAIADAPTCKTIGLNRYTNDLNTASLNFTFHLLRSRTPSFIIQW